MLLWPGWSEAEEPLVEGAEDGEGSVGSGGMMGGARWAVEGRFVTTNAVVQPAWGAVPEQGAQHQAQVGGRGGDRVTLLNVHQPPQARSA